MVKKVNIICCTTTNFKVDKCCCLDSFASSYKCLNCPTIGTLIYTVEEQLRCKLGLQKEQLSICTLQSGSHSHMNQLLEDMHVSARHEAMYMILL